MAAPRDRLMTHRRVASPRLSGSAMGQLTSARSDWRNEWVVRRTAVGS
jgi:hypothetical protein